MKEEQASKQIQKKKTPWKPIHQEIGMYALWGFITGISMNIGRVAFDKMTRSRQENFILINGRSSVVNG